MERVAEGLGGDEAEEHSSNIGNNEHLYAEEAENDDAKRKGVELYNILSNYLSKVTDTLQRFSNSIVDSENEIQKVMEDGTKLAEKYSIQREQLEAKNAQALVYQRSFHDSFEKVLKKQKCRLHAENILGS